MGESLMLYLNILSVAISLALAIISWKWTGVGRFLFLILFLWAAIVNAKTALMDPQDYLNYASLAWSKMYKEFINGFFASHTTAIVLVIAICQLGIAISMAFKGIVFKCGAWGAIVFLIAIAPLGVGSGFPSSLIMGLAIYFLLRKSPNKNLLEVVRSIRSNKREGT